MNSFNDIWLTVLEMLREETNQVMYNLYPTSLTFVRYENDTVFFTTDKDFKKRVIDEKFIEPMKQKFNDVLGFPVEIVVNIQDDNAEVENDDDEFISNSTKNLLASHYTFDNFVTCDQNQLAFNISKTVAENLVKFNPVYIWGASGLGKTHLLFATYNKMKERNPEAKIVQTSGQAFMKELFNAIRTKQNVDFHNTYRNADAIFIDDIQFISRGGDSLQEEIFYVFESLRNAGKQIFIISDCPPREIRGLSERLRTRFESGVIQDILPPDKDTRIVILQSKAEQLGFKLPTKIAEYIADRITTNVRQLEGVVNQIDAVRSINNYIPDLEEVKKIVNVVTNDNQPNDVIVSKIIERVSNDTKVSVEDIKSKKRDKHIKDARQVCIYIIKQKTSMTLKEIGDIFNLAHSTVLHSIDQAEKEREKNPEIKLIMDGLISDL